MIDIHVHLADARCISPGFIEGIATSVFGTDDDANGKRAMSLYLTDRNAKRLLSQMDVYGITKSVLLIADFGAALGEPAMTINEIHEHHAAVVAASDSRLSFFAGFDPSRGPTALDLVTQWTNSPGCEGVKLYPPCGFELNGERMWPLWDYCCANGIPVLSHSGPSLPSLVTEREYPQSVELVLQRYPDLRIILAHSPVWDLERTVDLLQRYPENLYADISSFQELSDQRLEAMLQSCFAKIPDQVLFGSDAPLYDFSCKLSSQIDRIRSVLSQQEQSKLFDLNAQKFLSGKPHPALHEQEKLRP